MQHYLEITHKYVVPLLIDPAEPDAESIVNSGVSMMEAHMRALSPRMQELTSSWQWMPSEYRPEPPIRVESVGLEDEDSRVNPRSAGGILDTPIVDAEIVNEVTMVPPMAVTHPWDQGLWIFPEDHPLSRLERLAKEAYDEEPDPAKKAELKNQTRAIGQGGAP